MSSWRKARGKFLTKFGEIPPKGIFTPNFLLMKLTPVLVRAVLQKTVALTFSRINLFSGESERMDESDEPKYFTDKMYSTALLYFAVDVPRRTHQEPVL